MRVLLAVAIVLMATFGAMEPLCGDDPLDAFPTADNSAADRVARLNASELAKIDLPADPKKVVFSFNMIQLGENGERIDSPPLLRVRADGAFDCANYVERRINAGSPEIRRSGRLTKAELQWLLHMAVNECDMLSKTTDGIELEIQENRPLAAKSRVKPLAAVSNHRAVYVYEVANHAASNQVEIPEKAMVLRSLRRKSGLNPVASLTHYAIFLTMRATLGDEKQRDELLLGLNNKLRVLLPHAAPFRIEHLRSAAAIAGSDVLKELNLSATFEQEIRAEGNSLKRIMGRIQRREENDEPEFVVWEI